MEISERWSARREPAAAGDPFAGLPPGPCALLYGDGPEERWTIRGFKPLLIARSPAQAAEIAFRRSGSLPPILPDFIGFAAYEFGQEWEPLLPPPRLPPFPFPRFQFVVYSRITLYDRSSGMHYEAERTPGDRVSSAPFDAPGGPAPALGAGIPSAPFTARKIRDSDTPASYAAKVNRIRGEIERGNVYQVNLTRQEKWSYSGDLAEFARRLYAVSPGPFSAFFRGPDDAVISSSPERFLRIANGRLVTQPIKGTAPRAKEPGEDCRLAQGLLQSPKNRAELAMITDLLRNDLTRVCRIPSVRVDAFAELRSYANVHHLVSTVSGELRRGITLDDLLRAVFPGGSVTGCPKLAARQWIWELEEAPRMIYTGALGWFAHDLSQLDLNLAIRTAWASSDALWFGVGGAVVWDSEPEEEYLETVHKGSSIVTALSGNRD
jgi:para-aminobenzoate synthetase component 1